MFKNKDIMTTHVVALDVDGRGRRKPKTCPPSRQGKKTSEQTLRMTYRQTILRVDDDRQITPIVAEWPKSESYEVTSVNDPRRAMEPW